MERKRIINFYEELITARISIRFEEDLEIWKFGDLGIWKCFASVQ